MWSLLVCALLISECSSSTEDDLLVTTDKGNVQGVTLKSATGKDVNAWLGIPFAKPPLGELRFKLPQPAENWNDTLKATSQPNSCVQTLDTTFGDFAGSNMWNANTKLSEDCLYLNVITPNPRPTNATVMVWLYGGGYYCGSATLDVYDPKTLASEENVIVVSVQYRVAALGFLYLESEDAPGNMGLFDQRLALKWVKQNIDKFGGNPNKVTLFGESSGSTSIALHLMAPDSHDLFSNAILESGTAFTPWAVMPKDVNKERGLNIAKLMNCTNESDTTKPNMTCLREANATTLVYSEWTNTTQPSGVYEFPFAPVVDSHSQFFNSSDSSGKNTFKKTSVLMGSNKKEGTYLLLYFLPDVLKKEENTIVNENQYKDSVKKIFYYLPEDNLKQIEEKYKDWQNVADDYKDALDKMVGDANITCSVNKFADVYAGFGQDVYVYLFDRFSKASPWPSWTGAMHGEEIYYVFGEPLNTTKGYDEDDKKLTRAMMKYWANFAKTGDPNKDEKGTSTDVSWPKYDSTNKKHLNLAVKLTEGSKYREEQCNFWTTVGKHVATNELDTLDTSKSE